MIDRMHQLPARELPLPDESLASLLRRTAAAMGYSDCSHIANLLPDKRLITWNANRLNDKQSLDRLAGLLRCSSKRLSNLTVHRYASRFVLRVHDEPGSLECDTKTALRYFAGTARVCPRCLKDDVVPYERISWALRPIPVCTDHECLLRDRCPNCERQLQLNRKLLLNCQCGSDIREWTVNRISSEAVETSNLVTRWLDGDTTPLSGLSTAACFWWMDRIRASIEKTPECWPHFVTGLGLSSDTPTESLTWTAAAFILRDWPERFIPFLEVLQHSADLNATSRIRRKFGQLPQNAMKLEALGYSNPADVLRDYLLNRYTQGHLSRKICLFRSTNIRLRLEQRDWITQTQAAKTLGVRNGSIRKLVQQEILEGEVTDTGGRTMGLVRRDSVERLCSELRSSLSLSQASKRLGIGPHQVVDLIQLQLLLAIRANRGWRIMQQSIGSLESTYRSLPLATQVAAHWLTARQATRIFGPSGLTFARLWQNIDVNQVRGRRLSSEITLKGLLVSEQDVRGIIPDVQTQYFQNHGYPLRQLAKTLMPGRPTRERVLKKWIAMGILRVTQTGRALICTQAEVDRFRATYCLVPEACQMLGVSRPTLARWEVEARIRPVYGSRVTPGAGFSLYLRSDLERLRSDRAAGRFRRNASSKFRG